MARPNYNLIRLVRRCIRQMKVEYGSPVTVYKLISTDTDLKTGVKTVNRESVYVDRAVVMPDVLKREQLTPISLISANKSVVQGGSYDHGTRRFIIDRTDVPGWALEHDDWIVYNGSRYNIQTIDEFEQETAWLIVARKIEGGPVNEDLPEYPAQYMPIADSASGVIE
jgi:hypothetical protein